jgi:hypothetical protein
MPTSASPSSGRSRNSRPCSTISRGSPARSPPHDGRALGRRRHSRGGAFDDAIFLEATAAKIRSAEAAQEGAAIAHQVHGAIGFTSEHILHRYTLRMLAWRDDFGNESHWAAALGNKVCGVRRGRLLAARCGPLTDERMTASLSFDQIRLPPVCDTLREEVRAFLADEVSAARSIRRGPATATRKAGSSASASAPRAGSA